MPPAVLGVSGHFHDSAAALVADGRIVAAVQQERLSRRRHDPAFPVDAVAACLAAGDRRLDDLDALAWYEDPRRKRRRVLATWLGVAPRGLGSFVATAPEWAGWKSDARAILARGLDRAPGTLPPVRVVGHHRSHAASAFLPGPFEHAAVVCLDSVGEWTTTSIWHGRGARLDPVASIAFPHSLGLLYSAFTYFCGFRVDSGEYKLMGLAPYGEPRHAELIRTTMIDLRPDGSFRLDTRAFEFLHGRVMTGARFERMLGVGPRREPEGPLTQRECDLAASVQQVLEEAVEGVVGHAVAVTGARDVCLAGGVALNCVANGRLLDRDVVDALWVQPAAGDAGGALGAALHVAAENGGRPRPGPGGDAMGGARLGPAFADEDIIAFVRSVGAPHRRLDPAALDAEIAQRLADGAVVGWFQGRAEFGPRALGGRSILADPRRADMRRTLNLAIKFRESFRPFAPVVLAEEASAWFDLRQPSPYMSVVARVAATHARPAAGGHGLDSRDVPRSDIPAVTHVDGTARVQTVDRAVDPRLHALLTAFRDRTGCPVLVNTSFNVRGEPIVTTPEQAYACFMRTDIDVLVLHDHVLDKANQPVWEEAVPWRTAIPRD